jgi:TonB family protein
MGIVQMKQGNYSAADSLFDLSIEIFPHKDAYFNKALTSLQIKDQSGFCDNMYWASFYGDHEADSIYKKHCLKTVTLLQSPYDSLFPLYSDKKYEVVEKNISGNRIKIQLFDKKDSMIASLKIINGNRFYSNLSYKAYYPGGVKMLNNFLDNNILYPQEAIEKKIQGKVYVSFVIDKNGNVKNERIISGIHKLLDDEALRVLKLLGRWIPATNKGVNVESVVSLNIDFGRK